MEVLKCDMKKDKTANHLSEYNGIMKENEDIYREAARKVGLSECSLWILYLLREGYTAPVQREICAHLHQPKQSINSALKKMEADGLIELACGSDRRSKQILLTSKGTSLCEHTVDRIVLAELRALGSLTDEEQETFLTLFHKLTDTLKEHMEEILQTKQ